MYGYAFPCIIHALSMLRSGLYQEGGMERKKKNFERIDFEKTEVRRK